MVNQKLISIVIPVFNGNNNITHLAQALFEEFSKLDHRHEIIFVDDGSDDHTLETTISDLHKTQPTIKFVQLSRNFGHQNTLTASYQFAAEDIALTDHSKNA